MGADRLPDLRHKGGDGVYGQLPRRAYWREKRRREYFEGDTAALIAKHVRQAEQGGHALNEGSSSSKFALTLIPSHIYQANLHGDRRKRKQAPTGTCGGNS
ncbi:hypothetical protein RRF57_009664 [Xylaria bambusicola]|uniref:Uncharacterized protein n=1 Tax=Xylaria bambusicola TaxID=326684 RepID=A0AAN7Z1X0_9PEZI